MAADRDTPAGLTYGLFAYIWWGIMPLYLQRICGVSEGRLSADEILGFRIVTGIVVLAAALILFQRGGIFLQTFQRPKLLGALCLTTALVGLNWYTYTYAVESKQMVEASLGYFIQPLFNVAMGAVLFREKFRPAQLLAIAIAAAGIIALVVAVGQLPLLALTLTVSFGLYSTIRKMTPVDGLVGLSVEMFFLLPFAAAYLLWLNRGGNLHFRTTDFATDYWVLASGFVTSVPMICFGQAARRLRLSTLGFLQYISPSLQFIFAVTVMGEHFAAKKIAGFALVGLALAVYSVDTIRAARLKAIGSM